MNFQSSGNLFSGRLIKARSRLHRLREKCLGRHSDPAFWEKNPSWFDTKDNEGFLAQNRRSE